MEGSAAVGSWLLLPSPVVKREERGGWLGLLPDFMEVWLFIGRRAVGSGAGDGEGAGKWVFVEKLCAAGGDGEGGPTGGVSPVLLS
ncbi:hypothetical protein HAX54_046081, partial [Datura stramonium]|nr:hypothetical protein [Datura stramonium]